MRDPNAAEALKEFLDECAITPTALHLWSISNLAASMIDHSNPASLVGSPPSKESEALEMARAMQDLGISIFRRLLLVGLGRRNCDTDLEQNAHDVAVAADLMQGLARECANTPSLRAAAELIGRVGNAMQDIWWNNAAPSLFHPAPEGRISNTAGNFCCGHLAAALEIAIDGGMKLAAAQEWLEAETRRAGLLDEAGNVIRGTRVGSWRNNYRKGQGAVFARTAFQTVLDHEKPLRRAPLSSSKRDACQAFARRLIRELAVLYNRTVPPPKTPRPRTHKKG